MSNPPSPTSSSSILMPDHDPDFKWNGLSLAGPPFGLEKIFDYEPNGHHPIHLGDHLHSNKYRVIHKLGSGGFANVWLCRDTSSLQQTKYVAVKILMADISTGDEPSPELRVWEIEKLVSGSEGEGRQYICLPLEQFEIAGPNGTHICFAYPVLGPKASSCASNSSEDPDKALRSIAFKVVQAVATLHEHGICHGDLTPSNVLLQIAPLDGIPEDEVIKLLGEPQKTAVLTESGEPPTTPSAPQYLVYPIIWDDLDPKFLLSSPCIIDFGSSFSITSPPDNLGIPGPYCSPELILDSKVGISSDIWALGCTLFEIRTGRKMLNLFGDETDDYIDALVQILGPLPEPWWSETWEMRKTWYEDEPDSKGRAVMVLPLGQEMAVDSKPPPNVTRSYHPSVAREPRSIQDTLAPGLWYMREHRGDIHREIPKEEIEIFADLLAKLFKYKPEERLSAKEALEHEWFRM